MTTNKNLDDLLVAREALREKIQTKEQELTVLSDELNLLDKTLIPELMEDLGITGCTSLSGKQYKISTNYFPKIVDPDAFAKYVSEDETLKNKVNLTYTVPFKDLERKEDVTKAVFEQLGIILEPRVNVHPQTLKAYVKNAIENNLQIPEGLTVYSEKKITSK